jgi:His-Xaa-Ser system protein HxsD
MSEVVHGLPPDSASADLAAGAVSLTIDEAVYPLEAVYGAAYTLIDRCYVIVDRPTSAQFRITVTPKKVEADEALLRSYVGELANELLSCAWRAKIAADNRAVIETVTMQAVGAAMGAPSLDDLASFDFTDEAFEDPLGIAMSWEEKYKKKDKAADAAAPAADVAAAPPAGNEGTGA